MRLIDVPGRFTVNPDHILYIGDVYFHDNKNEWLCFIIHLLGDIKLTYFLSTKLFNCDQNFDQATNKMLNVRIKFLELCTCNFNGVKTFKPIINLKKIC